VGNRGLLIEYKTLPGDLDESPTNEQTRDQVVIVAGSTGVEEVVVEIIQPLVTHSPVPCLYTQPDIKIAEQEMFARVRLSNNPKSLRTPNVVSCKFCKARFQCVEHEQWAASRLPATQSVIGTPIAQWTPEHRAAYCGLRGAARRWLDDCDGYIKDGLKKDPSFVPGYVLGKPRINRPVNDPQQLFNRLTELAKQNNVNPDVMLDHFMKCIDVKKGDVEGVVRAIAGLKGNGLKSKMDDLLSGIVDEKPTEAHITKA